MTERYLGDSVYIQEAQNFVSGIVLTTNNGFGASNIIYLELEVVEALTQYILEWSEERKNELAKNAKRDQG